MLYEVSYDKEALRIDLGLFYKVYDKDEHNPEYARFAECKGNNPNYIFSSCQTYTDGTWTRSQSEKIISLSSQSGYKGQFDIGFYASAELPFSHVFTLKPLPTPTDDELAALLDCIHKTREDIEIQAFFGRGSSFSDETMKSTVPIYQAWEETHSPVLRTRMLEIITLRNDCNHSWIGCLKQLKNDLDDSQLFASYEQFKLISMKILSGFMAVIGAAAVAVALVVMVNPIGIGVVAGIGAASMLASGYLFFNSRSVKSSTFDSYCEDIKPTLLTSSPP